MPEIVGDADPVTSFVLFLSVSECQHAVGCRYDSNVIKIPLVGQGRAAAGDDWKSDRAPLKRAAARDLGDDGGRLFAPANADSIKVGRAQYSLKFKAGNC